ncbi:MAG TPA: beta-glucosidase BglX [Pyrinomonadaceae bacterium]|nr:beta-glucosidase BglX [Pyrinomonadaceae bacterium]
MSEKRLFLLPFLLFLFIFPVSAQRKQADVERKINLLLAKMTLAEKLGQLQQLDGEADGRFRPEHLELARKGLLGSTLNVRGAKTVNELQKAALESRLKIPILTGFDVIHGYRTVFPIPLGETASWDLQAVERAASIAAAEARSAGVHWTFAPMVDIARDPRWGRVMEGSGEDTFLGSLMAQARVRGFQGADMSANNRVMATAKHFAAYGAGEAGRDYNSVDMSERTLRETYLPPFKAAKEAGAESFMTAFNDLDGVPATANPFLLRRILRDEWKFDGLVVSDYTAVKELIAHGLAANESEAAMYALNAGTDMEMVSRFYNLHGAELLKEKKISLPTIDNAVRNVLRVKFRLGLFERPYADEKLEKATIKKPEYMQAAREIAAKSFVLLKNERETLPINKNLKRIAVVGALAEDKANTLDWWAGDGKAEDSITILEGVRQKVGTNTKIRFEKGCELNCDSDKDFDKAVDAAKDSDFTILVVGETREISGEAASRSNLDLPGRQLDLVKAIHQTGKPYAVVLKNGRPLTINWLAENSPAILETWHSGTMGGAAAADVLFGDVNPGGKLPVTFPRNVGQIPLYYNHKSTGRPFEAENRYTSKYLDVPNTPLYPFGFGLSYTQFNIENLRLDKTQISRSQNIKISVDVTNTGKRDGAEVVQLYVQDVAASVTRPVRELKGFQKILLKAGEKRTVVFTVTPKDLTFLNRQLKPTIEDGDFKVFVGNSSVGGLEGAFAVGQKPVAEKKTEIIKTNEIFTPKLPTKAIPAAAISQSDDAFLEDLSRKTFQFFWEQSDKETGLTIDRARADGSPLPPNHPSYNIASSAATGFALTGLCVAAGRNWVTPAEARTRARKTLDFFANRAFQKNGWFYHWMDKATGERRWNSEVSSIDTALVLGGVLSVKKCFGDDAEIVNLATKIYERVDFKWMLNGSPHLLSHGWRPETGFIRTRWDTYSEHSLLYFLAIGSPTHPISPESWYAWKRDFITYGNYKYLAGDTPLFIHQFSQAWLDLRGLREKRQPYINYYANSVTATLAQRQFFTDIAKEFPTYSANLWGLTASDSQNGYIAWGAPPRPASLDGTIVPCSPAGSLMFTPEVSLAALREMKAKFGDKIYKNYGFVDAFNPKTGWIDTDVIGIDLGITLLSAENLRSGNVWFWFMRNPEISLALQRADIR